MKFRLTVAVPAAASHDITLECDATATIADAARALIRAGASRDRQLIESAKRRLAPVTLCGRSGSENTVWLLDPDATIMSSGLQSGWTIWPELESFADTRATRIIDAVGSIEVLAGRHAGVTYSLVNGVNLIGRDQRSRIYLSDDSVSRRHAEVLCDSKIMLRDPEIALRGPEIALRDLGSANGVMIDEERVTDVQITEPTILDVGEVRLLVRPGPVSRTHTVPSYTGPSYTVPSHTVLHTRAPRVEPRFPTERYELPSPPAVMAPSRVPVIAMLAPLMMGGGMYLITQSPMSLLMMAFTPIMMVGSWLDARLGGNRKLRREHQLFRTQLIDDRDELRDLRQREIKVRASESPPAQELARAISSRGRLLWSRRPEHRSFLCVSFGQGELPSRVEIALPSRGDAAPEIWAELRQTANDFALIEPVPVMEQLHRSGSIGVVGEPHWASSLAYSLILQLVSLHSPTELALACFARPEHRNDWGWLKWLPHVAPITAPFHTWPLADDEMSSLGLISDLERLLEARLSGKAHGTALRSHLDIGTRNDEKAGEGITEQTQVPAVILVVLDGGSVEHSRLVALAEAGPDVGIHLIWIAQHASLIPAACRTYVEVGSAMGTVRFVRSGTSVPLQSPEFTDRPMIAGLARRLAPVEDRSSRIVDESDLPPSVHLRDLHHVDLLGGGDVIVRAWSNTGSIKRGWRSGHERRPVQLAAVIGQGRDGGVVVDLRKHGPHALVGGTTGAGKSEFLQTWIMSLAAELSPDQLTFLLVDYKGGAAFAECVSLPHTVGLVTDLTPHLVRRALTSLRAELRYREALLAQHGAKDIIQMEQRSDSAAPPVLVIVIDEFAALATEVPEFVDGIIDIAQRGRSLGLHLIMATQRPAGVIKDNLRANTNLRVALRVSDEAESRGIVGAGDAALISGEHPGRAVIRIGAGSLTHVQTGYLGGKGAEMDSRLPLKFRSLAFSEGETWNVPPEEPLEHADMAVPRDIERVLKGIIAASITLKIRSPRRPWLDELPWVVALSRVKELSAVRELGVEHRPSADAAMIGLCDMPESQQQCALSIDFERIGSLALIGASGVGKTHALITLTASLSALAITHPVQVYGVDAAGGALQTISPLPTVGTVALIQDIERVRRMLRHLLEMISTRSAQFAEVRVNGLAAYRDVQTKHDLPRVVLLIDGFTSFRQATEGLPGENTPFLMLQQVMQTGRNVGVHVVLTADRPAVIPSQLAATVQQQLVFRLTNPHDYSLLGVRVDALDDAPPGRAVVAGQSEDVQIAVLGDDATLLAQADQVETLAAALRDAGAPDTAPIRNAPELFSLSELSGLSEPLNSASQLPVFGINTDTFEPVPLPIHGLVVISGPSGSGVSTAAASCVAAFQSWATSRGERCETALLTSVHEGLSRSMPSDHRAIGESDVRDLAEALVGGILPSRTTLGSHLAFPASAQHGVIVVERPADFVDQAVVSQLAELARAARRAGVLVIFEYETGRGAGNWELLNALRQPSWGVLLQPDDGESQTPFRESLGRVKRADYPPGRGVVIERGRVAPIHVAIPIYLE